MKYKNVSLGIGSQIEMKYFSGQTSILLLHTHRVSNLKVFPCKRDEIKRKFYILKTFQKTFSSQVAKSKTNQLFLTSVSKRLSGEE